VKLIITVDSETGAADARLDPAALVSVAEKLQAMGLAMLASTAAQGFMSGLMTVSDNRRILPPDNRRL